MRFFRFCSKPTRRSAAVTRTDMKRIQFGPSADQMTGRGCSILTNATKLILTDGVGLINRINCDHGRCSRSVRCVLRRGWDVLSIPRTHFLAGAPPFLYGVLDEFFDESDHFFKKTVARSIQAPTERSPRLWMNQDLFGHFMVQNRPHYASSDSRV